MVEGSILTLLLFGWLFMRAASQSEERQQLLDFAHANGLDLQDDRAARAVARVAVRSSGDGLKNACRGASDDRG